MINSSTLNDLLLHTALVEDLGFPLRDVTTELLFADNNELYQATIVSKHDKPVVICGIDWIRHIFAKFSKNCQIHSDYLDGEILAPGNTLLAIHAPATVILQGERIALNFLRHLSAIATLTSQYVAAVRHTKLKILDTRKTTPGMRYLEKYAIQCGGGVNHRMGLYDAIMVKDTHIDLLGGMQQAIARLPEKNSHGLAVIVEVRSPQELEIVLRDGRQKVTRVLLDNMSLAMLRDCVNLCHDTIETEASGNIRLSNIEEIAETGVNYASIGELTYNAGHVDLSMYTHCM